MELTDKVRRSASASYETVGEEGAEEAIIINLNTGEYYSLNDTGTMFWQLMDGQRTIADCAGLIAAEYDVDPRLVEADLLELAGQFEAEGLVVV